MKKILILSLAVLLIASGCGTNQGVELNNSSVLNNGTVLIAMPNPNQTPPPDNDRNLMREFKIIALNPTTGEEKLLTTIENNYFVESYGFYDNQIFYADISGEIYSYDLYSGEISYVGIPGFFPSEFLVTGMIGENTIHEFIIDDGEIVYLKGYCGEGYACTLGKFDTSTEENKIIIDNLQNEVTSIFFNLFRLHSYDPDSGLVTVLNSGGAIGYEDLGIYEINANTGNLKEVDFVDYPDCGGDLYRDCEDEDLVKKKYLEEMVAELNFGIEECLGVKITKGDYMQDYILMIDSDKYSTSYEKGVYIGCIE